MDPKRDFRLHGAAALASEAKQFGISVATLKTMIPAGTLCRSRKHDAISRFIPHDVEAEKTVLRYKVFKNLVGAKDCISGKYTEWHVIDVGVLEALAYREGMKEYEASSATPRPSDPSSLAPARSWSVRQAVESIEAKMQAGLRRCWKEQHDAGVLETALLVSAEIA
eukprot:jgi/Tetstr1/465094/TSEL_009822.t1